MCFSHVFCVHIFRWPPPCSGRTQRGGRCRRGMEGEDHDVQVPPAQGSSTTTFVDLMTAAAITPGFRFIASAASEEIRETILWPPACISI